VRNLDAAIRSRIMAAMGTATIPESVMRALDELYATGVWQPTGKAAAVLQISTKTLQRAANAGKIAYRRKGTRHQLFAREDVEAYLLSTYETLAPKPLRRRERTPTVNISTYAQKRRKRRLSL
jgi:excisionase family DNA binding protein